MKGFTLVEIMICVVILGVGLTSVANSYLVALRGANAASNSIGAMKLAKEKLEALEVSTLKDNLPVYPEQGVLKFSGKNYDYAQATAEIPYPKELAKSLEQVCLTLSWREQNIIKHATFSTYLSKQKQ
ncbi:MAG: prepilin-type N-terminal cleavage/methylation domain-containing protein [Candidatus Omnitrophota bacterium]|nr:prepilin-type N-terminal cleavage/methylation domain-containing protein [Candidatus Omnitrophota bacterium]